MSGLGGHGEGLRRNRDEAAGAKPGAKPVDRNAVNVGTVHVAVLLVAAASGGVEDRNTVHTGSADANGDGDVPFDIASASYGFTVDVSASGKIAECATSFTPAAYCGCTRSWLN